VIRQGRRKLTRLCFNARRWLLSALHSSAPILASPGGRALQRSWGCGGGGGQASLAPRASTLRSPGFSAGPAVERLLRPAGIDQGERCAPLLPRLA